MKIHQITSIIFLFLLLSCKGQTTDTIRTVNKQMFAEKINTTENPQILDVRTPEEFNEGHVENAKNSNWLGDHFSEDVEKLDKNKPVLVYCKSGRRSKAASEKLKEMGFKTIYNLDGGYLSWTSEENK